MLTLHQYKEIKQVKDSSSFTCHLSLFKYMREVKFRMSEWYGVDVESITDNDLYNEIVDKKPIFKN